MTLAKVKEQDGMMLAKVKEQDGMMLAKVKELASFPGSFSEKSLVQTVCACSIFPTFLGQLDG